MALERGLLRLGRRSAGLAVDRSLALRERGVAAAGAVAAIVPRWSERIAVAGEHATSWSVTGTLAVLLAVAAAWLMI
jgi:hypothetical protein